MRKKVFIICKIIILISLYLCMAYGTAYAELNGNAQSVIAEAEKIFEYNGKYYQATDSAISSLREKLDGKDMTEQEAAQAIAMINMNVGKGIEQGLLTEINVTWEESGSPEQEGQAAVPSDAEESLQSYDEETNAGRDVPEYDEMQTKSYAGTQDYTETQSYAETQPYTEVSTQEIKDGKEAGNIQIEKEMKDRKLPVAAAMAIILTATILMFYRIVKPKDRQKRVGDKWK